MSGCHLSAGDLLEASQLLFPVQQPDGVVQQLVAVAVVAVRAACEPYQMCEHPTAGLRGTTLRTSISRGRSLLLGSAVAWHDRSTSVARPAKNSSRAEHGSHACDADDGEILRVRSGNGVDDAQAADRERRHAGAHAPRPASAYRQRSQRY